MRRRPALFAFVAAVLACPAGNASADDAPDVASFGEQAGAPDEVPGEIAIDLRDDVVASDVAALAARYGLSLRPSSAWSWGHDKLEVADVDPAREASLVASLSLDPRVEHAEPMTLYRAAFVPD